MTAQGVANETRSGWPTGHGDQTLTVRASWNRATKSLPPAAQAVWSWEPQGGLDHVQGTRRSRHSHRGGRAYLDCLRGRRRRRPERPGPGARHAVSDRWLEQPRHALHGRRLLRVLDPAAVQHGPRAGRSTPRAGSSRAAPGSPSPTRRSPTRRARSTRRRTGKTNFWDHVSALFGVALPEDVGPRRQEHAGAGQLAASDELRSSPQAGSSPTASRSRRTTTPTRKNPYPLMRLVGAELDRGAPRHRPTSCCRSPTRWTARSCHASGSGRPRAPAAGWVYDPDPQRDFRLNILRLHDDRQLGRPGLRRRRWPRPATGPTGSTPRSTIGGTADPVRQLPRLRGAARQRPGRHPAR